MTRTKTRANANMPNNFVSILDFGADPTYTRDSTQAIQDACTFAETNKMSVYVPPGEFMVKNVITYGRNMYGAGRGVSILHHDGTNESNLLDLTSARECNLENMSFWGSGEVNGSFRTKVLVRYVNGTTRNINIKNCEFGRYAVNGYGAEIALKLENDNYCYALKDCLFDYHKYCLWVTSTNSFGTHYHNTRFEHASGFAAIVLENGSAKLYDCAIQFCRGAAVATLPDSIDETNYIISGNTASGGVVLENCSVEKNNRGQWRYTLSIDENGGTRNEIIGYINIGSGGVVARSNFLTGANGEGAHLFLVDKGSATLYGNSTSSSYMASFLQGGYYLSETVRFSGNTASGSAVVDQTRFVRSNYHKIVSEHGSFSNLRPKTFDGGDYYSYLNLSDTTTFTSYTNHTGTASAPSRLSIKDGVLMTQGDYTASGTNPPFAISVRGRSSGNWQSGIFRFTGGGSIVFHEERGVDLPEDIRFPNDSFPTAAVVGCGGARFNVLSGSGTAALEVDSDGNLVRSTSDRRLKTNITSLSYGLDEVINIPTYTYTSLEDNNQYIGVIAQELQEIIPEVVSKGIDTVNEDGETIEGKYSVDYAKLVPVLINAIKELNAKL